MSRVFYRIIRGPEPTLKDFVPLKELGRPLKNPRWRREWESAASVFDDLDYAKSRAREFPNIGSYIVTLLVPEDGSIEFAKTMDDEHHYSVYAPPDIILALVIGVPVPKE